MVSNEALKICSILVIPLAWKLGSIGADGAKDSAEKILTEDEDLRPWLQAVLALNVIIPFSVIEVSLLMKHDSLSTFLAVPLLAFLVNYTQTSIKLFADGIKTNKNNS